MARDDASAFPCERKVRVPRELYAELTHAQEMYQVPGGVSGIVRRAIRAHVARLDARGCAAVRAYTEPATRVGSTVLTVFLPEHLAQWLDGAVGPQVCGVIHEFLRWVRPALRREVPSEDLEEESRLLAAHEAVGSVAVVSVA